ncbi:ferritin-like domain-containing protein [Bdellovibrio sp. NC01]|uniref:ferritin-like domain-containing protein n=1 Tax=Bdellovibrio sp. NC01 TaxID=2220073 RepID=UPI00115784FA|nr:ferritin-like domain-containing protein [Bdellovibrio sp. NC01]QDK38113.1 hypothetical protein DOE51_11205 [Bdellovibrio sp. NC01]
MASSSIVIESRVQLFSTLAEAAELEHNFMCLYLYAMLGLKRSEDEGLTKEELAAVDRWRRVILGIALEEMTHLSLVSNLFVSMGSTPHFSRPNFPAYPGMYPANIVVELARFDMSTLDHFIFLERPRSLEVHDGETFVPNKQYSRQAPQHTLMAHTGDYDTVGDLYDTLHECISQLCEKLGEQQLFCGNPAQQIGPLDSPLPGLLIIKDKATAFQALDTIIRQGEGATEEAGSHFARFNAIKTEYAELLAKNPNFEPSRPVARNPIMRKPVELGNRVFVDEPLAAQFMDVANALYIFMLKTLIQIYAIENRSNVEKKEMLGIAYALMHAMATVGELLTHLPASPNNNCNAGMSFAMARSLSPLSPSGEMVIMNERIDQIKDAITRLSEELKRQKANNPHIQACLDQLESTQGQIKEIYQRAQKISGTNDDKALQKTGTSNATSLAAVAESSKANPIEIADSPAIAVSFEGKKCMHARHCVTQLPGVFLANTPGKWILPEKANADELASVIRQCPSGALKYKSKSKDLHDETAPAVNVLRLRENGPYAVLGDMEIDGKKIGYRATLCRCGQSQNKPFCDAAHVACNFKASGEPETVDATELQNRGGVLKLDRITDGPLSVSGNLELCTGTGRVVLRTESARLCRCGNSKSKPLCDSSHLAAGFKDTVRINEPPPPLPPHPGSASL